jgi:hypothetical protein
MQAPTIVAKPIARGDDDSRFPQKIGNEKQLTA